MVKESNFSVEPVFTSVGCNRGSNLSVLHEFDGNLYFGAKNAVAIASIFESQHFTVSRTLFVPGLVENVTSLAVSSFEVNDGKAMTFVFAGYSDGTVVIWMKPSNDNEWVKFDMWKHHKSSVSCLVSCSHGMNGRMIVFGTGSDDGFCHFYEIKMDQSFGGFGSGRISSLDLGKHFATRIGITNINCSSSGLMLLAIARTDMKVHLYTLINDETLTGEKHGLIGNLSGHENWILDVDFSSHCMSRDNLIYMATASQDSYIRVWKLEMIFDEREFMYNPNEELETPESCLEAFAREQNRSHSQLFKSKSDDDMVKGFRITLDSVLYGHSNWIYSAKWASGCFDSTPMLVSASADRSIICWSFDGEKGAWLSDARLGETGGNAMGFYGAYMVKNSSSREYILAQGYSGSFYLWSKEAEKFCDGELISLKQWKLVPSVTGHMKSVRGCSWAQGPNGMCYLLSTSADQTTRIWAKWTKRDQNSSAAKFISSWHEIARPQIHGYDLQCIASTGFFGFISGAEEKVIRVFSAPRTFIERIARLEGQPATNELLDQCEVSGANVPALGLSNKAVSLQDNAGQKVEGLVVADAFADNRFQTMTNHSHGQDTEPLAPIETELVTTTLWPEREKLYGHGYEIYALAVSPDRKYIATSCKSSTAEHASIRIWCGTSYKALQVVSKGHQLTVTKICFSPCSKYLLTVSRDRQWMLYGITGDSCESICQKSSWSLIYSMKEAHSRIIWSCCWFSDSSRFITCSRDKKIKVWRLYCDKDNDNDTRTHINGSMSVQLEATFEMKSSVQAISLRPDDILDHGSSDLVVLGAGLEDGQIALVMINRIQQSSSHYSLEHLENYLVPRKDCPSDSVNDFSWLDSNTFATVSNDNSVRIYNMCKRK